MTINITIKKICKFLDADINELKSKSKARRLLDQRVILSYFLYHKRGLTLKEVGKILGGRHHTSIIHYLSCFYDRYILDKEFRDKVNILKDKI